jgi:hypothetical protein
MSTPNHKKDDKNKIKFIRKNYVSGLTIADIGYMLIE